MSVATMPALARPLPKLPSSAHVDNIWRDRDGVLTEHAIELPVDKATRKINGKLFACIEPECPSAEWVIEPKTALAEEKKHCPRDGKPLSWVPLDPTQGDPLGSARYLQQSRLAGIWADKKTAAARQIRQSAAVQAALQTKAAAPEQAARLAKDMKGHLPSLAATAAIEIGVIYTVDLTNALETATIASVVTVAGVVVGYLLAVAVEQLRARLRKEGFEGRAARKARERGLWAGRGAISVGLFMAVTGAVEGMAGLDVSVPGDALKWGLMALVGLGLAWWTNQAHWERLWAARRRLRQLAADRILRAAEEEARRAEEEARRAEEAARLLEQRVEAEAWDDDDPLHQGRRMAIEWSRISQLETRTTGFPKIEKTEIVPELTREITAPDPETGEPIRIGWEHRGKCAPGALVTGSGMVPPILAAKEWLVSVLFEGQYDAAAISLVDLPDGKQNTFLIMITEKARLGDAVPWRAETATRRDHNGIRYGYLGRALTGDDLEETMYEPAQPFGGLATGTTGGGKGGFAVRYLLNCLFSTMLPILFDPKGLVDYGDFAGLFPIGFTKRHRRMIMEFLHAERRRREGRMTTAPKTNRYGAVVQGESRWNTRDEATGEIGVYGEPIAAVFDEFHDLVKDPPFVLDLTNHVRFQRAAAMGVMLLSQGGGLTDWGDSMLRDLGSMTSRTNFRGGDMQTRMVGGKSKYSTSDLPNIPGMCLRQAPGSPDVPLRAAFISRKPEAEDTVYTTLWGKGTEPVMQIEDPVNWISQETIEIMKETGVWDLWMMARGPGGLDRLRADVQEDEEDEEESASGEFGTAVARPTEKALAPTKMSGREVLLAILHLTPGLDREGILASPVWHRAPGWAGRPSDSTITRAADDLGDKIDRGDKSKSWTLTPAGAAAGARCAAQLPGPVTIHRPERATVRANAISVAEMAAQQAAEMAVMIQQEAAMAARGR